MICNFPNLDVSGFVGMFLELIKLWIFKLPRISFENSNFLFISATEAKEAGLVSKVYPAEELVDKAVAAADKIASHSKLITQMCKQATNAAYETTLSEGKKLI